MQNPIDKTSSICKERFSCFIFRIGQIPCRYNIWTENRCSGAVFQCFLQISSGYPDLIPYRIFLSLYTYFPVCIIDFERNIREGACLWDEALSAAHLRAGYYRGKLGTAPCADRSFI